MDSKSGVRVVPEPDDGEGERQDDETVTSSNYKKSNSAATSAKMNATGAACVKAELHL